MNSLINSKLSTSAFPDHSICGKWRQRAQPCETEQVMQRKCTCLPTLPALALRIGETLPRAPARQAQHQIRSVKAAARKVRPFQREAPDNVEEDLTEEEALTDSYLASLGGENWGEDPPGHRAGYVAIVGRPNAGKSTLVNAMVGQKLSIVTAKAQTTRHRILSLVNEPDYQMILLDTPGVLATSRNKLDSRMMRNVWQAARDADVMLAIVDSSAQPREALDSLNQLFEAGEARRLPTAIVLNKVDLIGPQEVEELSSWFRANSTAEAVIPTVAKLGSGVPGVRDWASGQLAKGPSLYPKDVISEEPERFFIAEIVREQIFLLYREEIPYSSTVEVTEYIERPSAKDLIRVVVTVESDSQKGILIGKGGSALKQLSTAARIGIEDFLEKPVYLDISIKVRAGWRSDEKAVARFGY